MDLMDYRRKIIANSPHLKSASGAVASFSDGAELPLKSLIVDIEPVQSGSGDPSPSNVRPISGWNGVKVTRCGKSLFNPHVYTGIAYNPTVGNTVTLTDSATQFTDNGNGVFTVTTSATWRYFNVIIPIDPTKEYATKIAFSSTGQAGVTRGYLDADFKILTKFNSTDPVVAWEYSLIPEANAAYYYFVFSNRGTASATLTLTQPQFVEGTTVGDYEPYNGVNVSIDLGQTVYGGTLNPLTGVLTVDSQIITGNANWENYWNSHKAEQVDTNRSATFSLTLTNPTDYAQRALCKCNMLVYEGGLLAGRGNKLGYCLHPTLNGYMYVCLPLDTLGMSSATSATSDNDFKAAIQALGNDLQIVIPLATPYTIQLTPHQIRTLYGNNTIFADTGNTSLEYWAHP